MKVLVACEESQEVCKAFRSRGHIAFSCDLVDCSGGHPEWHIKQDVLTILNPRYIEDVSPGDRCFGIEFCTCDNNYHFIDKWDMIIAFPPCTYLSFAGNRWFNVSVYHDKAIERLRLRDEAIDFFMQFVNCDCSKVCIENPLGVMSSIYRPPDQIIHPYYFGDPYMKRTCLWLKNLQPLVASDYVDSFLIDRDWYLKLGFDVNRQKKRSKTFPGVAAAMADQFPFTYSLI